MYACVFALPTPLQAFKTFVKFFYLTPPLSFRLVGHQQLRLRSTNAVFRVIVCPVNFWSVFRQLAFQSFGVQNILNALLIAQLFQIWYSSSFHYPSMVLRSLMVRKSFVTFSKIDNSSSSLFVVDHVSSAHTTIHPSPQVRSFWWIFYTTTFRNYSIVTCRPAFVPHLYTHAVSTYATYSEQVTKLIFLGNFSLRPIYFVGINWKWRAYVFSILRTRKTNKNVSHLANHFTRRHEQSSPFSPYSVSCFVIYLVKVSSKSYIIYTFLQRITYVFIRQLRSGVSQIVIFRKQPFLAGGNFRIPPLTPIISECYNTCTSFF